MTPVSPTLHLPLDHVVLLVPDLEQAADLFSAIGFTVTPRTDHSLPMGTANRCVMLGSTYIEFLSVVHATERSASWRELLALGGGLRGLALRTGNADKACQALAASGLDACDVLQFSRQDDDGRDLRFRICRLPAAVTPGVRLIVCEHQTPELLWRHEWTSHPNGAAEIRDVTFAAPSPSDTATILALAGAALRSIELTGPETDVRVASAGPARLTIAVANLERVPAFPNMRRNGSETEIDCRPGLDLILRLKAAS